MHRRKFIRNTLTGLPVVALSPTLFTHSCNQNNRKTVVVIGAGIAGLSAANKLKEKGVNVIVLEAEAKVGGRLSTNRILNFSFDEGASWIHGVNGNPLTSLAKKAGMTTFTTDDTNRKSYDVGGVVRSTSSYDQAENELYVILKSLMKQGSLSQSFETVFNKLHPSKANDRLWKFLLSSYVTFDTGDLNNLSSLYYDEGKEFGGVEKIATNGFDTIANYLAKGLEIKLNQRVSAIDYSGSKIKIAHHNTVTEADYAIVTVPLGVLKANAIQFVPELPYTKQVAIQKVGMNCVNKFLLYWDKAFWDDVQYISYTPETTDKFNYFVNVKKFNPSVNALITFAYADYARLTEKMTDTEVINEIMIHLRTMYGNNIPNPLHMLRTKWQTNENSLGAYSYTAIGTEMIHFEELAKEVNKKLFFAGEHTEVDYFSTVHGAYLSGIREARKISDL